MQIMSFTLRDFAPQACAI